MPEMSRFEKSLVNRRGDRFFRRLLDRIDAENALSLPESGAMLELGAGNGTLSAMLYPRYRPGHVRVTDYDPEQVRVAQAALQRRWGSLPAGWTLERADAAHLPYPAASFDLVVAHLMLHHVGGVNDELRALGEITRVLKPGGHLFYVEMIRKRIVRDELARLGYRVLFRDRRFRFFGFSDAVVAVSPLRPSPSRT